VQEIGLEAADGTLITRLTFEDAVDLDGTVTVTLAVSNDDSVSRGVLTTDGQTAVRDVLADNSPAIPTEYAYGSDGSTVAETDTALGNEVVSSSLDDVLLDQIDTESEWERVLPEFAADVPLVVDSNGTFKQAQTTQFTEAEELLDFSGQVVTSNDVPGGLSDGEGVELLQVGDFIRFTFSPAYDIPSGEANADYYRTLDNFEGTVETRVNGTTVLTDTVATNQTNENEFAGSGNIGQTLSSDGTHEMVIEITAKEAGSVVVDTMHIYDDGGRFGGFGTTRAGTFDSNTASYNFPELFPEQQIVRLSTFATQRDITESRVESTWNNVDNEQFIELSNDGGSNWIRTDNNDTATATFASASPDLEVRLGISRWDGGSVSTPTVGGFTQEVDLLSAFANPDAVVSDGIGIALTRGVISPGTIVGETIREAGLKNGSVLLTRHELAEFTVQSGERLTSSETSTVTSDN
jgi:hypothetical protein